MTVAEEVAAPVEQELAGCEGVTRLESESFKDGRYVLKVRLAPGTDPETAAERVRARVNKTLPHLPPAVRAAGVDVRRAVDAPPAFLVNVSGSDGLRTDVELSNIARRQVVPAIAKQRGVAAAELVSGRTGVVLATTNPSRLERLGVTAEEVRAALVKEAPELPIGPFTFDPLLGDGHLEFPPPARHVSWGSLTVRPGGAGKPFVSVGDVAIVGQANLHDGIGMIDGRPAILVGVWAWGDELTAADVRRAIASIDGLPAGVKVEVVADATSTDTTRVEVCLPDPTLFGWQDTQQAMSRANGPIFRLPNVGGCVGCITPSRPSVGTLLVRRVGDHPPPEELKAKLRDDFLKPEFGPPTQTAPQFRVGGNDPWWDPFPVRIAVFGSDETTLDQMEAAVKGVVGRCESDAGVSDVLAWPGLMKAERLLSVDPRGVKALGLTAEDVTRALGGEMQPPGAASEPFVVVTVPHGRPARGAAERPGVRVRNSRGEEVFVNDVVHQQIRTGPSVVVRIDRQQAVIVSATATQGPAADAAARLTAESSAVMPPGVKVVNLTRPR